MQRMKVAAWCWRWHVPVPFAAGDRYSCGDGLAFSNIERSGAECTVGILGGVAVDAQGNVYAADSGTT